MYQNIQFLKENKQRIYLFKTLLPRPPAFVESILSLLGTALFHACSNITINNFLLYSQIIPVWMVNYVIRLDTGDLHAGKQLNL